MNLLLDTHVLLWWLDDHQALGEEARAAIRDAHNLVFVSAASAWEIAIKRSLGKLEAPDDLEEAVVASRFQSLPITLGHAHHAGRLPCHHDDPFDRMLIAQAYAEQLTLITHDKRFGDYNVPLLWT
jgi:PIN domain nuclease of toxin-antitoxin system